MRNWILKFTGFLLWAAFLFAPFVVRAEEGFDTHMTHETLAGEKDDMIIFSLGGFDLKVDSDDPLRVPLQDKWSVRLDAGRDSVLRNDQPAYIKHDRMPLDDGENRGMRIGIGLHYSL